MKELNEYNNGIQVQKEHILLQPNALQAAENDLLSAINKALLTCYFELNQSVPSELDRTVLVNKILDSILEKYPAMRAAEIATAFSKGIRKEYGEYYGLCLISFEQFISGYLTSETRQKLVKERDRIAEKSKPEPTPAEKFETAKKLCIEAYDQVKASRPIGITSVTVYTFINALGLIDKSYKKDIIPDAMKVLVDEKEKDIIFCNDVMKRRQLNIELDKLKQGIEIDALTMEQFDEVKRMGKRIVITNYLRDLTLDDTDLVELIDSKREFYLNSHDQAKA